MIIMKKLVACSLMLLIGLTAFADSKEAERRAKKELKQDAFETDAVNLLNRTVESGRLKYKVIAKVNHKYAGTAKGVLGTNTLGAKFAKALITAMNSDIKGEPVDEHFSDLKFRCYRTALTVVGIENRGGCKLELNIYDPESAQNERILLNFNFDLKKDGSPYALVDNLAVLKIFSNDKDDAQLDAEQNSELNSDLEGVYIDAPGDIGLIPR